MKQKQFSATGGVKNNSGGTHWLCNKLFNVEMSIRNAYWIQECYLENYACEGAMDRSKCLFELTLNSRAAPLLSFEWQVF